MQANLESVAATLGLSSQAVAELVEARGLKPADLRRAAAFLAAQEAENGHRSFRLDISGEPPASKRPRAARLRNGAGDIVGVRVYADDAADQRSVRQEVRAALPRGFIPLCGEVELYLSVRRPLLAGWPPYKRLLAELGYLRPEVKPDYDNYAKILTDAMRGVLFQDDSQVVVGQVEKVYSLTPGLGVFLSGRPNRMTK